LATGAGQQRGETIGDSELERFKTAIDLWVYAGQQGYELDRKDSWAGSVVMRHANNDKIVIKRDADGQWVYFSVRNIRTDVKRREDVATPYVDPKSDPRQTCPRR
jgi:hypothetical protein